ncbi:MAG: type II toxin-antitoxin system RelE/ParE family toxin [Burkholderiales bacterium]|nr:type II toxin-antitoxin system RelE/ParE family toxin [Burkholderiales bacterium]
MVWQIEFDLAAKRELGKLDPQIAKRILKFLKTRVATQADPRKIRDALKGSTLGEFWKYRVGDFRIIASIQDKTICILVLRIGNRKEIYK